MHSVSVVLQVRPCTNGPSRRRRHPLRPRGGASSHILIWWVRCSRPLYIQRRHDPPCILQRLPSLQRPQSAFAEADRRISDMRSLVSLWLDDLLDRRLASTHTSFRCRNSFSRGTRRIGELNTELSSAMASTCASELLSFTSGLSLHVSAAKHS